MSNSIRFLILKKSNLFKSLQDDEIEKLSEIAKIKEYNKNEYIIQQDMELTEVYIIMSGIAKMCRNKNYLQNHLKPYNYFGENSLLNGNFLNHISIIAVTDVKCMYINRNDFNNVINNIKKLEKANDYDYENEKKKWETFCKKKKRDEERIKRGTNPT